MVVENGDEVFIIDDDDEDDATSGTSQHCQTPKPQDISAVGLNWFILTVSKLISLYDKLLWCLHYL